MEKARPAFHSLPGGRATNRKCNEPLLLYYIACIHAVLTRDDYIGRCNNYGLRV